MAIDGEKMGKELVETFRGVVTRALDPVHEHIGGLVQRLDEHFRQLESLERRASRHADHLARLEDRVKALETKGGR